MKSLKLAAAGLALATAALVTPAHAQDAAAEAAPLDPARLAAAQKMVGYLLPDGSYARMMEQSMDQIVAMSMNSVMDLPMRDLAALGGVSEQDLASAGEGTMREMMAILDPHFEERQTLSMRAMMSAMTGVMTSMEPKVREGLSEAYAAQFTAAELNEITRFFETPAGGKYAASSMMVYMDPAVMARMQEMVPALMQEMPAIIEETKQATAHLPPPRSVDELTEEERAKLGGMIRED